MAKKLEGAAKSSFDPAALKRSLADIRKHKDKAKEYNGLAGQSTKNAVETYNFDKKALTFVSQLMGKEPEQQLATLGAVISYAEALSMFAQMDMFNDAIAAMERVVEAAKGGSAPPATEGAANVAKLVSVN